MTRRGRTAVALATVVVSTAAAGGVVAATQSSDEAALQPARHGGSQDIERRIDRLMRKMNLQDKLNQIQLLSDGQINEHPDEASKPVGGVFSLTDPKKINEYQHAAMSSRLKIPILFAYDTIHGYRTIFPVPLGAASSFDPNVATQDHKFGARESAAVGLKQIYSPMVDVSHEPRWGRIAEAGGEDPYLNSVFAAARVKAAQGSDYSKPDKVVTSVKHYAAYGQPEGGRDYNTTDMSVQRLHNFYLPPFKAAVDAGADTAMCSFNAISGSPGCGDRHTETDILKKEWGFDGFIESDYTAVSELINHGTAADGAEAAADALNAGTDSEMVSEHIRQNGANLVGNQVSMARIDDAVRRILRVKFRAGLFEHPFVDVDQAEAAQLKPDAVQAARDAAGRSQVLLKNEGGTLPLKKGNKIAVIGPLGDNQHDMLGPWWGKGEDKDAVTVFKGISDQNTGGTTTFAAGCTIEDKEPPNNTPAGECGSDAGFGDALAKAAAADQIVLALGESRGQSGEAASRSEIDLPGKQEELLQKIRAANPNKPLAVVLFNGRPLTLEGVVDEAPAILEAWFPGVQAGNAVADVLFGAVNPGGKLPVSFPRRVGQVPIYYNHEPTGRPCDAGSKYNSRYRDIPSCEPQFPFGFGLSYSKFEVTNLRLDRSSVSRNGSVRATVDVANVAGPKGDEVVQLYLHDPVASISQPVRRLRGFERVTLAPGQTRTVTFTLDKSDFGFYDNSGKFVVEPGKIDVYAGNSSKADMTKSFTVTG